MGPAVGIPRRSRQRHCKCRNFHSPSVSGRCRGDAELTDKVRSLGLDLDELVRQRMLIVDHLWVDRSETVETGKFDLEGLFIRLGQAIKTLGARRIELDTIEALFGGSSNQSVVRAQFRRLFRFLKDTDSQIRLDSWEVSMTAIGPDAEPSLTTPETLTLPRERGPKRSSAAWEHYSAACQNVKVSGYQILAELGRGGMGVVYQARQLSLNRLVALKMLLRGGHGGEADVARLRAEAEAIAGLRHPNIIQIYEIGEQDGLPFLALEYCGGGSLDRKLNGTPIPAEQAAKLVETLARAIHAAHRVGVVHRDLKPANILLTEPEGQPKITDFGLAKRVDSEIHTRTGNIVGTPSYMAPEQTGGPNKQISAATDIYALGGILYELLTGRPPFRAASPMETIAQVLHQEPAPPRLLNPRIEVDLQTICLKCLEKDPARRYTSALTLADDLQRYRAREPISARSVNLLDRLSRTLGHSHLGSEFFIWSIILFYFAEVTMLAEVGLFTLISALPANLDSPHASGSSPHDGAAVLALPLATLVA